MSKCPQCGGPMHPTSTLCVDCYKIAQRLHERPSRQELKDLIRREPRRFIAQEIIYFKDLTTMENGLAVERKADLRAFVLTGKTTRVWASGLTRFSRTPESFVVNSSQGGGFKDTWVLSR